jgi:hypothetical protein
MLRFNLWLCYIFLDNDHEMYVFDYAFTQMHKIMHLVSNLLHKKITYSSMQSTYLLGEID